MCLLLSCIVLAQIPLGRAAANNISFLDKALISEINFGIYEIVTPKLESDRITYARKLPFDKLDYVERNEKYFSIGTAFFINNKELMTAAHVMPLMYFSLFQQYYIRDSQGKTFAINKIRKYSTVRDMVVFDLQKYPQKITPLEIDGHVEIGDTVFSVGNAQGEGIAYRAGQVASFTPEREFGKWKDIRFTSPASPGNSGGPLLNLQGKVVGLIVKKNQSENYNIAVPIGELDNLGDKAVFHRRNVQVGIMGVDDTVLRDWSFTAPLPSSIPDLARASQDSLNHHLSILTEELNAQVKEKGFPRGERFRNYLRKQSLVKGLGVLVPGKDFTTWSVDGWLGEKIPISVDQNVFRTRGVVTDLQVLVEKPEDISLKEFVESPGAVMDSTLKAVSLSRQIGTEKIPITSLGEPENKEVVRDKLGRAWITALWELPYDDMFIYSACLPYPKGVVCLFDRKRNTYRKYGYFESIHEGFNEVTVGYEGTVADWQEYFSLGKEYLPTFLHTSSITMSDGNLRVSLPDFSISFTNDKINDDSAIHLHMGYDNWKLLAEDLVVFELFPVKGAKMQYRVQPYFQPGIYGKDRYKVSWHDLLEKTGEFSGKPVSKGDRVVIKQPVAGTQQTLQSSNGTGITRVFVTGCSYPPATEAVEQDCAEFIKSVHFKQK